MGDASPESRGVVTADAVSAGAILDALTDPTVIIQAQGESVVRANGAARTMFDCAEGGLLGLDCSEFAPPEDSDRFREAILEAASDGPVDRYPDGDPIYVETFTGERRPVSLSVDRFESGADRLLLVTLRDVTDRVGRERKLRETTAYLETLLTGVPVPVVILDTAGTVERWNHAATEQFGWSASEIIGMEYPLFVDEDADLYGRILAGDVVRGVETVTQARDGSLLEVELYAQPVESGGSTDRVLLSLIDVTDLKQRERHLSVLHRVLRHNLRNKLNVIHASAQQLLSGSQGAVVGETEHATRLLGATNELIELGEQAQQIARDLDQTHTEAVPIELGTLLSDLAGQLSSEYPAGNITVGDGPGKEVYVPSLARVVVAELVEFAMTKREETTPSVRITARCDKRVTISVSDSGPGMADGERALVEEGEESELLHGSGLSLARVHMLVTELGGTLTIERTDDEWTTVNVELPQLRAKLL